MDDARDQFRNVLVRQKRQLVLTHHAQMRASERELENRLIQTDLLTGEMKSVEEQASEIAGERVFDIHVIGTDGQPMRYVLAINNLIRVITLMKVSRIKPGD